MPKRIKNVYEKIYDLDNLRKAHYYARKDKSFYKEVKMVDKNVDHFLLIVQDMLKNKTYHVSKESYTIATIYDKNKYREIWKLLYFPHALIQHGIIQVIGPDLLSIFCDFSCASIKDKGGKRIQQLMHSYLKDYEGTKYCLKIDIKKYYQNINHKVLKSLLRRKIKDIDLLELLDVIIDSYPGKRGLPIGSFLSQYLANFYLSYFDHRLKEVVNVKYVLRYMDDIVILGPSTSYLRVVYRRMKKYLSGKLKLQIKENRQIFLVDSRGIDYVGYRYFHTFTLLRKSTTLRFKQMAHLVKKKQDTGQLLNFKQWCSINSYIGRLIHCDSRRLYDKHIEPILPSLYKYYYYIIVHQDKKKLDKYIKKITSKKGLKHIH